MVHSFTIVICFKAEKLLVFFLEYHAEPMQMVILTCINLIFAC